MSSKRMRFWNSAFAPIYLETEHSQKRECRVPGRVAICCPDRIESSGKSCSRREPGKVVKQGRNAKVGYRARDSRRRESDGGADASDFAEILQRSEEPGTADSVGRELRHARTRFIVHLYRARMKAMVREHAKQGGFPANSRFGSEAEGFDPTSAEGAMASAAEAAVHCAVLVRERLFGSGALSKLTLRR
jgi:hypothetical protein